MICRGWCADAYAFPKGHRLSDESADEVGYSVHDLPQIGGWRVVESGADASAWLDDISLRAEHLEGPLNGGIWWVCVSRDDRYTRWTPSRSADGIDAIWIRNLLAGQWLTELVARCWYRGL